MRKIFKLTIVIATIACSGFQSANAGLLGMPLNLHTAIEAANTASASVDSTPIYPRYVDVFAEDVIAC